MHEINDFKLVEVKGEVHEIDDFELVEAKGEEYVILLHLLHLRCCRQQGIIFF